MVREDVTDLFAFLAVVRDVLCLTHAGDPSRSKVAEPLRSRLGDLRFDPLPSIFLGRSPSLL